MDPARIGQDDAGKKGRTPGGCLDIIVSGVRLARVPRYSPVTIFFVSETGDLDFETAHHREEAAMI